MIIKRVCSVLLLLVPLAAGGLMWDSTCDTIRNQLWLIGGTISDAARNIHWTPSYTANVDARLTHLLSAYRSKLATYQQHDKQVSAFVQGKLKQFSIPVDGLEENTSQLEKIFRLVDDRNAFQQLQVAELERSNHNLTTELETQQRQLQALEKQQQQLRLQLVQLNNTLTAEEKENRRLQALINDNPATVQG